MKLFITPRPRSLTGALLVAAVAACVCAPCIAQEVTGEQVRRSVSAATQWLLSTQGATGRWPEYRQDGGTTAIATLALLNSGVPADQPAMQRAVEAVRGIRLHHTYVVSLKIQALAAADPARYLADIRAAADWLVRAMHNNGMWGYDSAPGHTDFSNTQFAMLGLHEAAKAGVPIPEQVWRKAEQTLVAAQGADGGWPYVPGLGIIPHTGSMTAAGVASLYIAGHTLVKRSESGFTATGEAPRCGRYAEHRPISRGLAWLGRNFSAQRNPNDGSWYYYYMYGIERVGIIAGLRHLGRHDWYREGAAVIVSRQRPDGSWNDINPIVDTSFALLFLAKGHRPVLIQKLQWSEDARWNPDRNDIAHLIGFIGNRIGGPFGWEVVHLRSEVSTWHRAPILYMQGHEFPEFKPEHIEKLRTFVREGGTLLAEACCGRSDFRAGFAAFAKVAFPEYDLYQLPPEHPVFKTVFEIDGSKVQLKGINLGCRTSIFFSPVDLSCLWEQGNIPVKSRAAFELGTNIAAYATGMEPLPDKLDVVRVRAAAPESRPADAVATGAVHMAQLIHSGDWRPDPNAIPRLAEELHERHGVDVVPASEPLRATDPRLSAHPIVYMTGHYSFELKPDEVDALRRHLERGGFLFADACCGRKAFDTSFRELARQLFPDRTLERLPATHPIIAGSPGVPLASITYKPALQAEQPGLTQAMLEGVTIDDRTAVVYSQYSIGCGVDGHACFACRGPVADDARSIAGNIILYALSY